MCKDVASASVAAAALYEGGWRATDREQLRKAYGLTAAEAAHLCRLLKYYQLRREGGE